MTYREMVRKSFAFASVSLITILAVALYLLPGYQKQNNATAKNIKIAGAQTEKQKAKFNIWKKYAPAAMSRVENDYGKKIEKIATVNRVNPSIIKAVAAVESGGNSEAVSNKGAVGVMGVKPIASLDAGKKYIKLLKNPDYNITVGVTYLKKLEKQYGFKNNELLLAYNEGPTKAKELLRQGLDPQLHDYVQRVNYAINFTH